MQFKDYFLEEITKNYKCHIRYNNKILQKLLKNKQQNWGIISENVSKTIYR